MDEKRGLVYVPTGAAKYEFWAGDRPGDNLFSDCVLALVAVVASAARRRWVSVLGIVAVVLCAAVVWPGVVDQVDLDVRWVNAIAAAGVVLALVLTAAVTALEGIGPSTRVQGDRLRLIAAVVLVLLALPWIVAGAGFLIGKWPVFGSIYYSDEWYAPFGHARLHQPDVRRNRGRGSHPAVRGAPRPSR